MKIKSTILILSLSSAMSLYADNATNTIPILSPGFGITLTGLWLQPGASGNNLTYAIRTEALPLPAPNWEQQQVDPGYTPTFDLGLQYTMADGVDQVKLDWLYLNNNSSAFASGTDVNNSIAPPFNFGPLAQISGLTGSSEVHFQMNTVNLVLEHFINLTSHIQIGLFGGINTAYLKEGITDTYTGKSGTGSPPTAPYSITTYNTSEFTGIGPRLGLDATYFLTPHFGILAEMAGSLLLGSMESKTNFYAYSAISGGNNSGVNTQLANQSQAAVVPEVDSKLGFTYSIPINNAKSTLTMQAGYMFAVYINGINQVVPTSLVPNAFNNGTMAIETDSQESSDLDLNGPYASLTYTF